MKLIHPGMPIWYGNTEGQKAAAKEHEEGLRRCSDCRVGGEKLVEIHGDFLCQVCYTKLKLWDSQETTTKENQNGTT